MAETSRISREDRLGIGDMNKMFCKRFPKSSAPVLMMFIILAGCATPVKQAGNFRVETRDSAEIRILDAQARVKPGGLVVTGAIHFAPNLPPETVHSVDIVVTGPDGQEIRKFTSQYFPAPKPDKRKPQQAHFTMVTYSVPPAGTVIKVSLTPEPKPDELGEPAPESR